MRRGKTVGFVAVASSVASSVAQDSRDHPKVTLPHSCLTVTVIHNALQNALIPGNQYK